MKTTKTTTTAFQLEGDHTVIGYDAGIFYLNTSDGILQYCGAEMDEVFHLSHDQILNMKQVLSAGRPF